MYNATIYRYDRDGKLVSVFVGEVNEAGKILRANSIQCTGLEGTEQYDKYLRDQYADCNLVIVRDGCDGYRRVLKGLALPPAYRV